MKGVMKHWRIHREGGAVRLELGYLWLIHCASRHPNRFMIVWRRRHERDPKSRGQDADAHVHAKYEFDAEMTAEREAAADPAQAARLRAIDQLPKLREKRLEKKRLSDAR